MLAAASPITLYRSIPFLLHMLWCAASCAQYEAVLPFTPLTIVDTIGDPAVFKTLREERAYIGADGTSNIEGDQGDTRDLVLISHVGGEWLIHLIPLEDLK